MRTINRYIKKLGWRKVNTKYCQIVSPCDDVIDVDECTVELRTTTYKNWNKPSSDLLRAHGGKIGKPKHNLKIHLFGGISRKGLSPQVIFTEIMYSKTFRTF